MLKGHSMAHIAFRFLVVATGKGHGMFMYLSLVTSTSWPRYFRRSAASIELCLENRTHFTALFSYPHCLWCLRMYGIQYPMP